MRTSHSPSTQTKLRLSLIFRVNEIALVFHLCVKQFVVLCFLLTCGLRKLRCGKHTGGRRHSHITRHTRQWMHDTRRQDIRHESSQNSFYHTFLPVDQQYKFLDHLQCLDCCHSHLQFDMTLSHIVVALVRFRYCPCRSLRLCIFSVNFFKFVRSRVEVLQNISHHQLFLSSPFQTSIFWFLFLPLSCQFFFSKYLILSITLFSPQSLFVSLPLAKSQYQKNQAKGELAARESLLGPKRERERRQAK